MAGACPHGLDTLSNVDDAHTFSACHPSANPGLKESAYKGGPKKVPARTPGLQSKGESEMEWLRLRSTLSHRVARNEIGPVKNLGGAVQSRRGGGDDFCAHASPGSCRLRSLCGVSAAWRRTCPFDWKCGIAKGSIRRSGRRRSRRPFGNRGWALAWQLAEIGPNCVKLWTLHAISVMKRREGDGYMEKQPSNDERRDTARFQ